MKATPKNQKLYWDSRAKEYPLPFDPATLRKTRRILALLRAMGVRFAGRRVLDIGCGTGVYALPLAAEAVRVLGLDSSGAMLRVFSGIKRERGIKNAGCRRAAWEDVPLGKVAGHFGVALASMTMAVRDEAGLRKMEAAAAGGTCVYIGWAGRRRNPLMEKLYAGHGLRYRAPEGAAEVRAALRRMGRRPKVKFIDDSWTRTAGIAETLASFAVNMKVNGARLREDWTLGELRKAARGGKVRQRTSVRKAVIVWNPPLSAAKP